MLFLLFISILLSPFRLCAGSPVYHEYYRNSSYVPDIIAPDTLYVATTGRDSLYFIDTRFDHDTAQYIKNQIEAMTFAGPDDYVAIDEFEATAAIKNRKTGETVFTFDPPYARVFFASGINRNNPELKLPKHEPAGNWQVTYDLNEITDAQIICSAYDCDTDAECRAISYKYDLCHGYRLANGCEDSGTTNAIGSCIRICVRAVDTPREDGETDTSYYQRMDKLHWYN
ncbi:hypothetical protein N7495_006052 [Penicillium taxi]|uniref:uncharacterized protein n=1 Tax=Penicillium taxi TaxID=168475 RepID=UPI002544DB59|nr:uncharacterized protein N7495_006052 [Penicillium taxi]KAJ5894361.1 hypothetical protein N7495_006052 [Penicillium taxi]